jgi:branched-chain amino acid transport system substrate-binding protein
MTLRLRMAAALRLGTKPRYWTALLVAGLALLATGCAWGVVADSTTGQPVPGARITFQDSEGGSGTTFTGDGGLYAFEIQKGSIPARGTSTYKVTAPGYQPLTVQRQVEYDDNAAGTWEAQHFALQPIPGGTLKIGLLMPFTGGLSGFGPEFEKAARLAANHINAAGGVLGQDGEIVTGDTGTSPTKGVAEARRLVTNEKVSAIVGAAASGVTLPVAESVTGPSGVVQISPSSTSPALTDARDNGFLFRTTISDAAQGLVLADLADDLGFRSACTMYINNAYGYGLSQAFADAFSGVVTAQVPHESGQATYAWELGACTAGRPDVLVAASFAESARVYLREAVDSPLIGNFLLTDGTKSLNLFNELGWHNFDGMRGTAPSSFVTAFGTAFENAYHQAYGTPPPLPFLGETYDAVVLIALAAERAGSVHPAPIRNTLRLIANAPGEVIGPGPGGISRALSIVRAGGDVDYQGATSSIEFDQSGDTPVGAIEIWQVNAAARDFVTERVVKVDVRTGAITAMVR